ncbi:hypothetical protein PPERSA_05780 [Pseudocohnilembus persalinus]|uniref:RBR-type E3 ubiquitin transferase n=1 Tax=Pseudocohnilembus persalinus TaxID=266149 RepID=A0A0V0R0M4_PSEPJ|nr:hypothetical protein PPERSA_05780 [Pseudocohnilembus persalinus]|eukprot:KRX07717.1 hypothetical protein PPERSA_05780 [Pseudocohnilembus persalinus]
MNTFNIQQEMQKKNDKIILKEQLIYEKNKIEDFKSKKSKKQPLKTIFQSQVPQQNAYSYSKIYVKSTLNSDDFEENRVKIIQNKLLKMGFDQILIEKYMGQIENTKKFSNQILLNIVANKLAKKRDEIDEEIKKYQKKMEAQDQIASIEYLRKSVLNIKSLFFQKNAKNLKEFVDPYPRISFKESKLYQQQIQEQPEYQQLQYEQEEQKQENNDNNNNQIQIDIQQTDQYQQQYQNQGQNNDITNAIYEQNQFLDNNNNYNNYNNHNNYNNLNNYNNNNNYNNYNNNYNYPQELPSNSIIYEKNVKKQQLFILEKDNLGYQPSNPGQIECSICLLYKEPIAITKVCNHHEFCFDCINEYYSYKIEQGEVLNIKCIKEGCPLEAKQEDIELFISPIMFKRYLRLKDQKQKEQQSGVFQCPEINCQGFCDKISGLCSVCYVYSCSICENPLHPGIKCQNIPINDENMAKFKNELAPCPGHFNKGFTQCQQFKEGKPYHLKQGMDINLQDKSVVKVQNKKNKKNKNNTYQDLEKNDQQSQEQKSKTQKCCDSLNKYIPCITGFIAIFFFPLVLLFAWIIVCARAAINKNDKRKKLIGQTFCGKPKKNMKNSLNLPAKNNGQIRRVRRRGRDGIDVPIIVVNNNHHSSSNSDCEGCEEVVGIIFIIIAVMVALVFIVCLLIKSIQYSFQIVFHFDTFYQRVVKA